MENSADLGLLYTDNGEKIEITDGHNIIKDEKYYLLSLLIGLKGGKLKNVVIPYHYPRIIEQLVKKYKGNTVYSKSTSSDLIQTVMEENEDFQYILNFDGIWAIGKILDYLVENNTTLNEILKELPDFFYIKKEIPCRWIDKGNIIRRLSQEQENNIELIEGVRFIEDKGWVLIIPDEERPVLNLYIEGYSQVYAEELWEEYNLKLGYMMKDLLNLS